MTAPGASTPRRADAGLLSSAGSMERSTTPWLRVLESCSAPAKRASGRVRCSGYSLIVPRSAARPSWAAPASGCPGAPPYWMWRHLLARTGSSGSLLRTGGWCHLFASRLADRLWSACGDGSAVLVLDDLDQADASYRRRRREPPSDLDPLPA